MPDTYQWKTQAEQTEYEFTDDAIVLLVQEYENGRNSGAATGIIKLAETITQKGTAYIGTYSSSLAAPAAPTGVEASNITDSGFRVKWVAGARSETFKVYVDGLLHTSGISTLYLDIGSRAANTAHSITVKGTNVTGDSAASTAISITTLASDSASDATTLSTDAVTVATVSGSPKIVGHGATNKIYDVRYLNKALTLATDSYYWKDVLENEGKVVIPR